MNEQIDDGVRPEEIIYTSFTRAACNEAVRRVLSSSEMNYRKEDFPWFKTEHAICFKLLGLKKDYVFTDKKIQEFSDRYPIYKFTNHGSSFEERHFEMMLQSLGDYYEFFVNWMDNNMLPFSEAIREFMKKQIDLPDEFSASGARTYMERRDTFKQENCLWDFSDMIHTVAQRRLCPEFKVLVGDEIQDCSPLLMSLIQMWSENALKTYIGGDKFQCVPEGTKIATPDGDRRVELLKRGDRVIASYGSGHAGVAEIADVHIGDSSDTRVTITTKMGKRVVLTSKHQLFSLMPLFKAAPPKRKEGLFYVYLMYKTEIGWRIGLTNQPATRIRGEGCAPLMHIIAAFDTWEEGIYQEEYWSLKYGIPTQTFVAHDKRQFIYGDLLRKMCKELDVESRVRVLADDLGIDLRYPIHIPQSTTRRSPARVVVNVRMTTLNDHHTKRTHAIEGASGWHWLTVETSSEEWQRKLEDMGFKLSAKRRTLRVWSKDFEYIMSTAHRLMEAGALIKVGHTAQGSTQPGVLTVAGNIMRGYKIPVFDKEAIIWDEVVDVKKEPKEGRVYDLDIATYHNYIAEGVMVHNSIYGFAGAKPELFDEFEGELTVLPHSYRLTPQVKDYAEKLIGLTKEKFPEFTVDDRPGQVTSGQIQTIDWLNLGSAFVLARTRRQLREIGDRLKIMGVPFAQERLGESPLESSKGIAFLTLIKLSSREKVNADELRALAKHTRNPWLLHGAKTKIKDLVQMEYTFQQVAHFFSQNFLDVVRGDFLDVLCQDIDESDKSYLHRVYKKCGASAFLKKPEITLTTIHGSKGRQRETVIISPELGRRAYDNFAVDKRSEVFVAYVAATRSMKRVILLPRETPESFPYPRP